MNLTNTIMIMNIMNLIIFMIIIKITIFTTSEKKYYFIYTKQNIF